MSPSKPSKGASKLLLSGDMEDMNIGVVLGRLDLEQQTLKSNFQSFQVNQNAQFQKLETQISEIARSVSEKSRTNWPLLLSMMAAITGAVMWVNQSQISQATTPLAIRMEVADKAIKNTSEIDDSQQFAISELEGANKALQGELSKTIEISNLREKHQQQLLGILWREMKGYDLPDGSYEVKGQK